MNKAIVTAKPGEPVMTIERNFDAPPEKVFMAMTRKDLVERWWIGPGYSVRVEELDAKNGGSWKFVQTNAKGDEFNFRGVFHLVKPPTVHEPGLIIQTTEYEGLPEPDHVGLEKLELIGTENGTTRMISRGIFLSVEDRDLLVKNGMEGGMQNTYNKLDEVLKDATF